MPISRSNFVLFFPQQLLDELENEEVPAHIREARMSEFKEQLQRLNDHQLKGYGTYRYKNNKGFHSRHLESFSVQPDMIYWKQLTNF